MSAASFDHRRAGEGVIEARIVSAGSLSPDPPGLPVVADLFQP